jgi:hypothetical protein
MVVTMFSKEARTLLPTADPGRLQRAEMSISNAHFCRMTLVCAVDPIAATRIMPTWQSCFTRGEIRSFEYLSRLHLAAHEHASPDHGAHHAILHDQLGKGFTLGVRLGSRVESKRRLAQHTMAQLRAAT